MVEGSWLFNIAMPNGLPWHNEGVYTKVPGDLRKGDYMAAKGGHEDMNEASQYELIGKTTGWQKWNRASPASVLIK